MSVHLQVPAPAPSASSQLLITLDLLGDITAPLTSQQSAAVLSVTRQALARVPGISNISLAGAQVRGRSSSPAATNLRMF